MDASRDGLGAVLCQQQDGKMRVISYASRGLSKAERNYSAYKLEFLALKWAVTEKYHDYLYGSTFTVLTDNNPLSYVLTNAKLDATGHRWLAALAMYNFSIKYRPGVKNTDADSMSRLPPSASQPNDYAEISSDAIKALQEADAISFMETVCMDIHVVDDQPSFSRNECNWGKLQMDDFFIAALIQLVRFNEKPSFTSLEDRKQWQLYSKYVDQMVWHRNALYRQRQTEDGIQYQLVLPEQYRKEALHSLHDRMGHMGRDRTLDLIRDRFFWPRMGNDVADYVKACGRCLRRKCHANTRPPLVNIHSTQPLEIVCMDYLTLERSKGGYQHLLVITDHFTKYALAIPTRNQTAKTTAEALWNGFISHYGFPHRLHSDQGANFCSKIIKELCTICGIQKSRTTPYNPAANGLCERMNKTLLDMLGTLPIDQKSDWKSYIAPLVHAYNCTRHESTGYAPFHLMFGRQPRLPIDYAFGLHDEEEEQSYTSYMDSFRKKLKFAYDVASEKAKEAQKNQKSYYDLKARAAILDKGDRVLVRTLAFDGKHKIADRWEEHIYIVLEQPNMDIPVYVVRREDGIGRKRSLHRKHLLPLGSLPIPEEAPVPKARKSKQIAQPDIQSSESEVESDASSSFDTPVVVVQNPHDVQDEEVSSNPAEETSHSESEPEREEDSASESDDDEEEHDRDAQSGRETEQEDQSVNSDSSDEVVTSGNQRPVRQRRPPAWYRSGEYVMALGTKDSQERIPRKPPIPKPRLKKPVPKQTLCVSTETGNTHLDGTGGMVSQDMLAQVLGVAVQAVASALRPQESK